MNIGDTVKIKPPHEQDLVGEIIGFEEWPRVRWNNGGESTCAPGAVVVIPTCCRKHQDLGFDDHGFCAGAPRAKARPNPTPQAEPKP